MDDADVGGAGSVTTHAERWLVRTQQMVGEDLGLIGQRAVPSGRTTLTSVGFMFEHATTTVMRLLSDTVSQPMSRTIIGRVVETDADPGSGDPIGDAVECERMRGVSSGEVSGE